MNIGPEGHRKRLRERFQQSGFDGFHTHEILEFLLCYAIPRKDVKPIAKSLIHEFGSLAAVFDAPLAELRRIDGLGEYASLLIHSIPGLLESYQQDRWKKRSTLNSTGEAVAFLAAELGAERNEVFCILALNSSNSLIANERIQEGTVNRTAVFPRRVVEATIKHRASAVILAHNHPGGDPQPSAADRQLTRRLKKLLNDLDIVVHDHIIIGGHGYYSFSENGALE
ncbi:MAG: DNA repair protein RadC [Deltaproteobacteria bacterium]|nr:DNA repair protein RadC [Deltaproteobacteria bacterium]